MRIEIADIPLHLTPGFGDIQTVIGAYRTEWRHINAAETAFADADGLNRLDEVKSVDTVATPDMAVSLKRVDDELPDATLLLVGHFFSHSLTYSPHRVLSEPWL